MNENEQTAAPRAPLVVYSYNPDTREYTGTTHADPCQLDPEAFLHPAHTTPDAPPDVPPGKVARFVGGAWALEDIPSVPFAAPAGAAAPASEEERRAANLAALRELTQGILDAAARSRGFLNSVDAVSYAEEDAEPVRRAASRQFRNWRSRVWAHADRVVHDCVTGAAGWPAAQEYADGMPPYVEVEKSA